MEYISGNDGTGTILTNTVCVNINRNNMYAI